jgi:hypothetical protein
LSLHVTQRHRKVQGAILPKQEPGVDSRVKEEREECEDRSQDRVKMKVGGRALPRVSVTPRDTSTSGGY